MSETHGHLFHSFLVSSLYPLARRWVVVVQRRSKHSCADDRRMPSRLRTEQALLGIALRRVPALYYHNSFGDFALSTLYDIGG
jgi:hypothetical protein